MNTSLHTTIDIALAAGALLRQGYDQQKQVARKSTAVDWVTQFDTDAEAPILDRLQAHFPGHQIVAEESGYNGAHSRYTWYIDPLDGTNNFAHGFPVFCVSLALYEDNQPLLGVIYDPLRDECFSALRGQGATLRRHDKTIPLRVSETTELVNALVATGFPYDRHTSSKDNLAQLAVVLKKVQGIRRAGSAALDLAYVAAGWLDAFWEFKLNSWDIATGILLIQEAGGQVTQINGDSFEITPKVALLASNGRLHLKMLDILNHIPAANAQSS